MIVIDRWYGRFGNNIVQIVNALCIALNHNCCIQLPEHDVFDVRMIKCGENKKNKKIYEGECFFRCRMEWDYEIYKNPKIIKVLRDSIPLKIEIDDIDKKSLLIHIRSGDNFEPDPHPCYIQPPLLFYEKVIEKFKGEKIILLTQDRKNPIINKLLSDYDIELKICSLEKSLKLILSCPNVCFGIGSFIPATLLFSTRIEKVFYPDYFIDFTNKFKGETDPIEMQDYLIEYLTCEKEKIALSKYLEEMNGDWTNSKEQRNVMLNYQDKEPNP